MPARSLRRGSGCRGRGRRCTRLPTSCSAAHLLWNRQSDLPAGAVLSSRKASRSPLPAALAGGRRRALRLVQPDHPLGRLDLGVLQRVVGADLYALRVAAAEVAVVRYVLLFVEPHHAKRAGDQAHLAADALVVVDEDAAVGVTGDGVGGAVAEAGGVLAVEAGDGHVHRLVHEIVHEDACLGRLKGALMEERAGALAKVAGDTLLGVGEDHFHTATPSWCSYRARRTSRYLWPHTVSTSGVTSLDQSDQTPDGPRDDLTASKSGVNFSYPGGSLSPPEGTDEDETRF